MFKQLNILLFLCYIGVMGQNYSPIAELDYPQLVAFNSSFDVSLITDNSVITSDALKLYIISKNNLDINSVIIRGHEFSNKLTVKPSTLISITEKVLLIDIIFRKDVPDLQSFFQILINCSALNSEVIDIRLYGEFVKDGKVVSTIGEKDNSVQLGNNNLEAQIFTYKPDRTLRNAARFENNSFLKIDLKDKTGDKVWIDFWFKLSGNNVQLIKLVNSHTGNQLFALNVNSFQKLYLLYNKNIVSSVSPFYSRKTWNHLGFEINNSSQSITFYSNGDLIEQYDLKNANKINELKLEFENTAESPFTIEQLRIIDKNYEVKKLLEDARYNSVTGERLIQINFDTSNELNNYKNKGIINYIGIKLVTSDAPILSRTPELNVQILSSYNQLEWQTPDNINATEFIIEKSTAENGFNEIAVLTASGDITGKYSYIDASVDKNEIVFYRVKQINKDGSFIYSAQVKVGMGIIEQFNLDQNYPNPFNPVTSFELDLYEDTEIDIIIYNLG
ncbi:MAG: hypothetical protein R6W68_01960, partial [Ignavibacteriaceae bacterium]